MDVHEGRGTSNTRQPPGCPSLPAAGAVLSLLGLVTAPALASPSLAGERPTSGGEAIAQVNAQIWNSTRNTNLF